MSKKTDYRFQLKFQFLSQFKSWLIPIIIFIICVITYTANGVTLAGFDSYSNSILAFNLLENHTLHLDILSNSFLQEKSKRDALYFLTESSNGHLTSLYPIGTAIVTFPAYILFYIRLKLSHIPIDLTAQAFDSIRLVYEKRAAVLVATTSVIFFYLASRLRFGIAISLITTFIFAFATETWVIGSQALWQHGSLNLVVIILLFCLIKADQTTGRTQSFWLVLAGFMSGLIPGIRPSALVISIATLIYTIFIFRKQSILFCLGLLSALPSALWNLYYFGNLLGGYKMAENLFSIKNLVPSTLGILFSPSRGLFIYSPILIFVFPGIYQLLRFRHRRDTQLLLCLGSSNIIIFLSYCVFEMWWGGYCYGPRFLTDCLIFLCYTINYSLEYFSHISASIQKISKILIIVSFILMLVYSTYVQMIGAFGLMGNWWNVVPLNINDYSSRLWDWKDSPIERYHNAFWNRVRPSITSTVSHPQALKVDFIQVTNQEHGLSMPPTLPAGSTQLLRAKLHNLGNSEWFGCQQASVSGEVRLRVRVYDNQHQQLAEGRLFIPNITRSGQLAEALGSINLPPRIGLYQMQFDLLLTKQEQEVEGNSILHTMSLQLT